MATGVLDSIGTFINSPPGQLAAGAALAGLVWKFFERIEAVLTDQTKLEIAGWLRSVEVGKKTARLRGLLLRYFNGMDNLGLRLPVCYALLSIGVGVYPMIAIHKFQLDLTSAFFLLCDCAGLFILTFHWVRQQSSATRTVFEHYDNALARLPPGVPYKKGVIIPVIIVAIYQAGTVGVMMMGFHIALKYTVLNPRGVVELIDRFTHAPLSKLPMMIGMGMHNMSTQITGFFWNVGTYVYIFLYPILTILLLGSTAVIVKAREFDIRFSWFNRKFDVEKKPLQSIGLVAGAIVAIVYWSIALIYRLLT
jgi:hypothetical protein